MHRYSLSVDARLRIVLAYLDTLKLPARTIGQQSNIPQLSTPATIAAWLIDMSEAAITHVVAIYEALPAVTRALTAPCF